MYREQIQLDKEFEQFAKNLLIVYQGENSISCQLPSHFQGHITDHSEYCDQGSDHDKVGMIPEFNKWQFSWTIN